MYFLKPSEKIYKILLITALLIKIKEEFECVRNYTI